MKIKDNIPSMTCGLGGNFSSSLTDCDHELSSSIPSVVCHQPVLFMQLKLGSREKSHTFLTTGDICLLATKHNQNHQITHFGTIKPLQIYGDLEGVCLTNSALLWFFNIAHAQSMGRLYIYLPTFTIKINHSMLGKDTIAMGERPLKQLRFFLKSTLPKL